MCGLSVLSCIPEVETEEKVGREAADLWLVKETAQLWVAALQTLQSPAAEALDTEPCSARSAPPQGRVNMRQVE